MRSLDPGPFSRPLPPNPKKVPATGSRMFTSTYSTSLGSLEFLVQNDSSLKGLGLSFRPESGVREKKVSSRTKVWCEYSSNNGVGPHRLVSSTYGV